MKKQFTSVFKAEVVHELLKGEKTLSQISAEHGVAPTQLSQWKSIALKGLPSLFESDQRVVERVKAGYELRLEELFGEIGRLTTKLTWLQKRSGIDVESH
jgi:transposase-like protein